MVITVFITGYHRLSRCYHGVIIGLSRCYYVYVFVNHQLLNRVNQSEIIIIFLYSSKCPNNWTRSHTLDFEPEVSVQTLQFDLSKTYSKFNYKINSYSHHFFKGNQDSFRFEFHLIFVLNFCVLISSRLSSFWVFVCNWFESVSMMFVCVTC